MADTQAVCHLLVFHEVTPDIQKCSDGMKTEKKIVSVQKGDIFPNENDPLLSVFSEISCVDILDIHDILNFLLHIL